MAKLPRAELVWEDRGLPDNCTGLFHIFAYPKGTDLTVKSYYREGILGRIRKVQRGKNPWWEWQLVMSFLDVPGKYTLVGRLNRSKSEEKAKAHIIEGLTRLQGHMPELADTLAGGL